MLGSTVQYCTVSLLRYPPNRWDNPHWGNPRCRAATLLKFLAPIHTPRQPPAGALSNLERQSVVHQFSGQHACLGARLGTQNRELDIDGPRLSAAKKTSRKISCPRDLHTLSGIIQALSLSLFFLSIFFCFGPLKQPETV